MRHLILTGGFILLMASCAQKKEKEQAAGHQIMGDTLIIAEHSPLGKKLKTDTVHIAPYRMKLSSAATVKAIPNFFADIAPPFSGRVTKVYMKLGMNVNPGSPLFEMVSSDFMESQKNYFSSKSELKKAELDLKRQKDLKKNGVASSKDLEEAESTFEVAQKEYQNNRAALKIFNVDPDHMSLGQPLIIRSPIKGQVITNELVTGHYIKDDDAPHARVAELNKVWVVGQVKEKDIRFIHPGDEVDIDVAAYPDSRISGKVYHVDQLVDEETRSVQVLIVCDNPGYKLKPGMYATVNFTDNPLQAAFVPVKAVLQMNDNSFVFVEIAPGRYLRRKVVTGPVENDQILIRSGLQAGERIVAQGGFYLLQAK
jgi:cobalt-zinc-cadmium efflux system membrane fusion protein